MTVRIVELADHIALMTGLADAVAEDLRTALRDDKASFAAPGGSTPRPFLEALAAADLDWSRVTIMPGDERWTPPTDERSNEGMIRFAMRAAADARHLSFWREETTPVTALGSIEDEISPHLPLTSAVIGMGTDMHCASLFPGGDGLAAAMNPQGKDMVAAITAPGAGEPRVTLTARALSEAGRLRLLIVGDDKRRALETALAEGDPLIAPVGAVLRRAREAEVWWAP